MEIETNILVVDDEPALRHMVEEYLTIEGYDVSMAANATQAYSEIKKRLPDIILLDIAMPGEDGMSVAKKLRQADVDCGIIMLTAKTEVVDRILGLESGADDYLTKPFHMRELLARIRSLERRSNASSDTQQRRGKVEFDRWTLNMDTRNLNEVNGQSVELTGMEFELLCLLVSKAGSVVSRAQISTHFGTHWDPTSRKIDVLIMQLRTKIELEPSSPVLLKTVRGAGYVLACVPIVSRSDI